MKIGNRASQHNFSMVPDAQIPRSKFNRSFGRKQTFNADFLVPVYLDEVLPGDTHNVSLTAFGRLATPIVPVMDNLHMDYHFWFVPTRLVWDNWEKFNGAQKNPGDSTDYLVPQAYTGTWAIQENTLANYMGLPKFTANATHNKISALPFRCYNLIFNEWYRDQNLQNSVVVDTDDGPDSPSDYTLLKRGKRHDYFTSALPFPQKGPSVPLPLGQSAPVYGVENKGNIWQIQQAGVYRHGTLGSQNISGFDWQNQLVVTPYDTAPTAPSTWQADGDGGTRLALGSKSQYDQYTATSIARPYADLTTATAATINQLREAFQIQRLYERDARGGTRYIEIIRSHFGVQSPDARLQRPEYLGGGSATINIAPIAQTSSTDETSPQGNLAAMGTHIARSIGFQKAFVEHGYIIGLASARADLSYQEGVERLWGRSTRFDFYWPTLSHLGEQTVLNSEIYAQGNATDNGVFGFQERYAEYRYKPSQILGTFMSTATGTLDIWHYGQDFSSLPALNSSFIQSNTPIARSKAVLTEPDFLWDGYFNVISARPMPSYSVPGLIDHF